MDILTDGDVLNWNIILSNTKKSGEINPWIPRKRPNIVERTYVMGS